MIYACVRDLFFRTKIQEAALRAGQQLQFVDSLAGAGEGVVLVDLEEFPREHPASFRQLHPQGKLVGYLTHQNVELRTSALQAGYDLVIPRSIFVQQLPDLVAPRRERQPTALLEDAEALLRTVARGGRRLALEGNGWGLEAHGDHDHGHAAPREPALVEKKCIPCEGGVPPLTGTQVAPLLAQLRGWYQEGETIQKEYQFATFLEALRFVNAVACVAEGEGHHPDLLLHGWNKVHLTVSTHAVGGLTENDFILAAKVDRLPEAKGQ